MAIIDRKISQREMATLINRSESYVCHVIAGRRHAALHLRRQIAKILNADIEWLFEANFHVPPPSASVGDSV